MKHFLYIVTFILFSTNTQDKLKITLVKQIDLEANTLVSVDAFNTIFYISENVLFKRKNDSKGIDIGYNNFQLGDISSVNTFNSLKINVFYRDFNTAIILDNRLAEMFKIDFNTITPYKNVSHITTGFDNTIWVFNQNNQQLELFDYKTKTTRAQTLPIKSKVLDLKSNYNNCILLTEDYIYVYNYFGSLIKKLNNTGFTEFYENQGNLVLKKEDSLFFYDNSTDEISKIEVPNLSIDQFFVTNETLYIYDKETIYEYQIKTN
ncbi:hypothetical protein [Gaetbulibacter saemankumensis]|uniref:hypothetical protein n=1 Tax=Gaetbulibacter saemankumensis TaxID=311208 RepID=UPI0003FD4FBA|nr:hypothetical protein [Gaetbulibacter saemankumensis]